MLPLDVPFVPDGDYPEYLAERTESLSSVHFSLYDPALADARQLLETREPSAIVSGLKRLGALPKYVLLNTRLHAPEAYFSKDGLGRTAERLTMLADTVGLTGLVFADPYYLQALADAHPEMASRLEAVPSVNTMLDSAERAFAMLSLIEATPFRLPSRIVLDRGLNREMNRLIEVSERLRASRPDLKLLLMANEGCLYACPYKQVHNSHVAMVNQGLCGERTFAMNRDLGCVRRLLTDLGAFLSSPFIRPEDQHRYDGLVDGIKLCGRNKGVPFLIRTIDAYVHGKFDGNLLDLMDAMGDLADRVHVDNRALPDDYLERVSTCAKDCGTCGWCAQLAETMVTRRDPGLPAL